MTLTLLLLRRYRLACGSWLVLLVGACAGTVSAYQTTYATDTQRRTAVEQAQHNAATILLYGRLPDPGTPAQLYGWEIGAIVTVLAAVMAVLVAVWLTRAGEDDGTLELLRGCGVSPRQPLRSALVLLTGIAALMAAGCAAAAGLAGAGVDGVTRPAAVVFGAVVGTTFLCTGVGAVVVAQVAPSAGQARLAGLAVVGAGFAVRAFADTGDHPALNWVTPLGLRAVVEPFTANRWPALLPAAAATVALGAAAAVLDRRREFGAGLIRRRDRHDRRLRIRTPVALGFRLVRASIVVWTVAVAALAGLFTAMGSGVVRQQQENDLGGFLGAQLGAGDPAAAYLAYCHTVVGIVVTVYAVLSMHASRRDEEAGLTGLVRSAGVRRWAPLAAQATVTATGCAVILTVAGILSAAVAPAVIDGTDVAARAMAYATGQWPAAIAGTGCATLLIGLWPRLSGLAWLPVIASGGLALLGELLHAPPWLQRLGFYRHVPDIAVASPDLSGLLMLVVVGVGLCLAGVAGASRRDLLTG